jgi:hypothetical protein
VLDGALSLLGLGQSRRDRFYERGANISFSLASYHRSLASTSCEDFRRKDNVTKALTPSQGRDTVEVGTPSDSDQGSIESSFCSHYSDNLIVQVVEPTGLCSKER